MEKFICSYCARECKNLNSFRQHEIRCKNNPNHITQKHTGHMQKYELQYCQFCGKQFNTSAARLNHEKHFCESNPDKELEYQFCKYCNKLCTTISIKGHEIRCTQNPNRLIIRVPVSDERKQKLSQLAKDRGFGGLTPGSGQGISGWYKGYWCDSTYELIYTIYNLDHNIKFDRCPKSIYYEYTYQNRVRKYYPDYILPDNSLVEIKGWKTPEVDIKLASVTDRPIKILYREDLEYAFEYVKNTYEYTHIEELYTERKKDRSKATTNNIQLPGKNNKINIKRITIRTFANTKNYPIARVSVVTKNKSMHYEMTFILRCQCCNQPILYKVKNQSEYNSIENKIISCDKSCRARYMNKIKYKDHQHKIRSYNKYYTDEVRQKMSLSHIGEKDSSFGKHWYYDPLTKHNILCFDYEKPKSYIKGRWIFKDL